MKRILEIAESAARDLEIRLESANARSAQAEVGRSEIASRLADSDRILQEVGVGIYYPLFADHALTPFSAFAHDFHTCVVAMTHVQMAPCRGRYCSVGGTSDALMCCKWHY